MAKQTKNEKFNLEAQFIFYCNKVQLKTDLMTPIQLIETKRAFMAGMGQCLHLITNEAAALPDNEAEAALQSMFDQVGDFWVSEVNRLDGEEGNVNKS